MMLQIGIFAPQGGCDEHKERLEEAYGDGVAVGDADSLAELAGLVISGPTLPPYWTRCGRRSCLGGCENLDSRSQFSRRL
jgi:hypothetical protein